MSSFKRQLAVATATVGITTALWHTAIPDHRRVTPQGQQQTSQEQFSQSQKREQEERRAAGNRLGDAVHRDSIRPAEVRPAERAANDIARLLLRRVP